MSNESFLPPKYDDFYEDSPRNKKSKVRDDHDYNGMFPESRIERARRKVNANSNTPVIINQVRVNQEGTSKSEDIPTFARIVIYFNMALLSLIASLVMSSMSSAVLFPVYLILCGLISAITFVFYIFAFKIYWYLIALGFTMTSLLILWGLTTGIRIGNYLLGF